jgi:hypothetical protein
LVASNRAVSTPELNEIIQANARYISARIPLGEKWVTGADGIVVTVGSDLATLPPGFDYSDVLEVRRTVDGQQVMKRTREEMDKLFWGQGIPATHGAGEPTDFCLIESETQSVVVRFQAPAKTTTTLDFCRRVLPADLTSDASAIPFSVLAIEALIDLSSVEVISKLPEKVLAERNLNPQVAGLWAKRAEENLRHETERLHRQRGVGRPLRFVP